MDEEERVYDIGNNAADLGWGYMFFKFVWPVLLGIIGIVVAVVVGFWFLRVVISSVPQASPAPQYD